MLESLLRGRGVWDIEHTADEAEHRILKKVETIDNFGAYMIMTARFVAADFIKEKEKRGETADDFQRLSAPAAEEDDVQEMKVRMEAALAELRDEDRSVIRAYYGSCDDEKAARSRAELAARLGISVETLQTKVSRIRSKLRELVRRP
jgi:RNA polymerase sigma factor (sigma-70 family)